MVSSEGIIPGLFESQEENSFHKILTDLIDSENVALKTEIANPLAVAQLKIIAISLQNEALEQSSAVILEFIEWFLTYMVSYDRKSRTEIIAALTEGLKAERTLGDKLTKSPE